MDIWIVDAAATACKNLLGGRHDCSDSSLGVSSFVRPDSLPNVQQVLNKNCSSVGEVPRKKLGEGAYTERLAFQGAEVASSSTLAGENLPMSDHSDNSNLISCSNSLPVFLSDRDLQGDQGGRIGGNINDPLDESSLPHTTTEIAYGVPKKRSCLRSRRNIGHVIKPLTSLESCLMAQLYNEHDGVEDYIFSSFSSPFTPTVSPFVVADGSRFISRGSLKSLSTPENKLQGRFSLVDTVCGVPQLSNVGSVELQGKLKANDQVGRFSDSSRMINGILDGLHGSSHALLLFSLGISVGIMSSFWANRKEIHKLNEALKQSENLIQDLQEELEMKDSLTVEELVNEDIESRDTHINFSNNGALHPYSPKELDKSTIYYDEKYHSQKTGGEPLSKIEAELEAELERLELNVSSSKLEGKLSELVELDPDFVPDVAERELRTDLCGRQAGALPCADRDGIDTSIPHSVNHAVSPKELSLRLHEVVQSQLQDRIKELELALHNSNSKVRYMEAELVSSSKESSNSEAGSSSTQSSPVTKVGRHTADHQPAVIHLSGDTLDAYNEACNVFTTINHHSAEEDVASRVKKNNHQETLPSRVHNFDQIEYDRMNIESVDGDDELDRLLINHIVNKARKGSPAVLNAQRLLFSLDDSEH